MILPSRRYIHIKYEFKRIESLRERALGAFGLEFEGNYFAAFP